MQLYDAAEPFLAACAAEFGVDDCTTPGAWRPVFDSSAWAPPAGAACVLVSFERIPSSVWAVTIGLGIPLAALRWFEPPGSPQVCTNLGLSIIGSAQSHCPEAFPPQGLRDAREPTLPPLPVGVPVIVIIGDGLCPAQLGDIEHRAACARAKLALVGHGGLFGSAHATAPACLRGGDLVLRGLVAPRDSFNVPVEAFPGVGNGPLARRLGVPDFALAEALANPHPPSLEATVGVASAPWVAWALWPAAKRLLEEPAVDNGEQRAGAMTAATLARQSHPYSLRRAFLKNFVDRSSPWHPDVELSSSTAERAFPAATHVDPAAATAAALAGQIIYAHPPATDASIGAWLRLIAAAINLAPRRTRALVLVPWRPRAQWIKLVAPLRHAPGSPFYRQRVFQRNGVTFSNPPSETPALLYVGFSDAEQQPDRPLLSVAERQVAHAHAEAKRKLAATQADTAIQQMVTAANAAVAEAKVAGTYAILPPAMRITAGAAADATPSLDELLALNAVNGGLLDDDACPGECGDTPLITTTPEWSNALARAAALCGPVLAPRVGDEGLAVMSRVVHGDVPTPKPPAPDWFPSPGRSRWNVTLLRHYADITGSPVVREAADLAGVARFHMMAEPTWHVQPNQEAYYVWHARHNKDYVFYREAGIVETYDSWRARHPRGTLYDFAAVVQDLGAVNREPDTGKTRPVLNNSRQPTHGRSVNQCASMKPGSLPSVASDAATVEPGDIQARMDQGMAFLHNAVDDDTARYLAFIHPEDGLARFKAAMFGGRPCPGIQHTMGNALCEIFAFELRAVAATLPPGEAALTQQFHRTARIFKVYVDDYMFNGIMLVMACSIIIVYVVGYAIGGYFAHDKTIIGSAIVKLGALVDAEAQLVRIAPAKAASYAAYLIVFVATFQTGANTPAISEIQRLHGRLRFASSLSRWGLRAMTAVRLLNARPSRWHDLREAVMAELVHFWIPVLQAMPSGTPADQLTISIWELLPIARALEDADFRTLTDASGDFGAGGVTTFGFLQRCWEAWELSDDTEICVKELEAMVDVLIQVIPKLPVGCTIVASCDNTAAVVWLNRGGAKTPKVTAVIAPLARAAAARAIRVRAVHRAGTFMMQLGPDEASRRTLAYADRLRSPADDPAVWREDWHVVDVLQHTSEDSNGVKVPGPRGGPARPTVCPACSAVHAGAHLCPACLGTHIFGGEVPLPGMDTVSDAVAQLLGHWRPASTNKTYRSALNRVVKLVQRHALRNGVWVQPHDILPRDTNTPVAQAHLLAFLLEARGKYATQTIEQTFSAVADFERERSFNTVESHTKDHLVRRVLEAVRRSHAGTVLACPQAALPIPAAVVAELVKQLVSLARASILRGDLELAFGYSRDALYAALAFPACLRQGEVVAMRRSHIVRLAGTGLAVFIPTSKTDPYGHGAHVPIPERSASGIPVLDAIMLHDAIICARGVDTDVLFGHIKQPKTQLASADSVVDRLNNLHLPCLRGVQWPPHLRVTGHSFRRGGINALRDALRTAGVPYDEMRSILLRVGRWRDPLSLEIYLVESLTTIARRVQLA